MDPILNCRKLSLVRLSVFAFSALLWGCSSTSIPTVSFDNDEELEKMKITIEVAEDINPNQDSRPSPLVLTVYQLASDVNFNRADPYALLKDENTSIGAELKNKSQITLFPGKDHESELKVQKQTQFLGILGSFQDIDSAKAKIVFRIDGSDPDNICLLISGISLKAKKSC